MGLKARVPAFIQEKALRQSSPYDTYDEEILNMSNKNMSLEALFLGLPFSGSGIVDKEGYYLGTDEDGKIIILSPFCKTPARPNSNLVITGASGSGKSYLAKKILFNEWLNGTKIYAIDPEGEMRNMCKKVKGKWIDCSGGVGENVGRLNPLQVNPLPTQTENDEEDEYISTKSALSVHMSFLSTFFKLYFPDISTLQMSILMETLEELYRNFNITWETDVTRLKSTEFPIMENLYYLLEDKAEKPSEHKQHYETLRSVIRGLAIGESKELFNGYSTIKIDNNFVCFDVSSLQNSNENIKRCQYLNILRFCENLAFRDRTEKVYVACDEAYLLIDKKIKESIEFLRNFCKRCRKYQSGLMIISQNLVDFLSPEVKQYGQAILDNSTYKFFFGTDGQDLVEIVRIYNLNQDEKAIISQKDQGRGLLFIGSGHMLINVKGQKYEEPFLVGGGI